MKTAVSIPEHVFEQAERVARSRGWTRSYLYTEAVRAFMETPSPPRLMRWQMNWRLSRLHLADVPSSIPVLGSGEAQ